MCVHCKGVSRRGFLEAVSASAAVIGAGAVTTVLGAAADPAPPRPSSKVRVGKVFLAVPSSGWPKPDLDLAADVRKYEEEFAKLQPQLADVEFVDGGLVTSGQQLAEVKDKFLDNWSCGLHRVVFYGDHTADLHRFCRLKGIRLVNEETDDVHQVPGLEWQPTIHA